MSCIVVSEDFCFLLWIGIVNTFKPKSQLWQLHPGLGFFHSWLTNAWQRMANMLCTGRKAAVIWGTKVLRDTNTCGLLVCISLPVLLQNSEEFWVRICWEKNKCFFSWDCFDSPVNSPGLYQWTDSIKRGRQAVVACKNPPSAEAFQGTWFSFSLQQVYILHPILKTFSLLLPG